MEDQYRISAPTPPHQAATSHYKLTSVALWIGLAVGFTLNLALQTAGMWILAIPFGAVAAFSGIALVARAIVTGKRR